MLSVKVLNNLYKSSTAFFKLALYLDMKRKLQIFTILLLSNYTSAVPFAEFYPFGATAGDTVVPRTDDGSSPPITLPAPFMFFGNSFTVIHVSSYRLCISFTEVISLLRLGKNFKISSLDIVWGRHCLCVLDTELWDSWLISLFSEYLDLHKRLFKVVPTNGILQR